MGERRQAGVNDENTTEYVGTVIESVLAVAAIVSHK